MKNIVYILLVFAVILFVIKRGREKSRIEMIDYLNANVSNVSGKWTQMSNDELASVYKVMALVKQSIRPTEQAYINAMDVLKKYGIANNSLVNV